MAFTCEPIHALPHLSTGLRLENSEFRPHSVDYISTSSLLAAQVFEHCIARPHTMATEICCVCSKVAPRPVLICMKCSEGVDKHGIASPTYCCEKSCRERGKKEHERLCKHMNVRKQIYRAGELLQAIFYQFREAAFDMRIKRVVKSQLGSLLVSEERYTDDRILFRFPHEMIPDAKDKAKLLTMQACTDGCAFMLELSKALLRGESHSFNRFVIDGH